MGIIADRETIELMVCYGASIIFLNEISEKRKGGFVGKFKVTEESCGGGHHKLSGKHFVFKAFDLGEMAAQFLGLIWALQNPGFSEGKIIIVTGAKGLNFREFIRVNDNLKITIPQDGIKEKIAGKPDELSVVIIGKGIAIFCGRKRVATIGSISLVCADKKTLCLAD